jgi:hypothetical protein
MEEYSLTYSDVVANGFRAHHAYPELKVETQWICSDSGLVSAQFAQLAMSQMSDVEFEQLEFSGVTLPPAAQWKVGFAWDSAYQMTGKMTLEGIGPVTTQFDIAATNEIAAQEEVTVPAGIYPDAMRVDSNTTIVITGKAGDLEIPPINFEFTNSNWHVKDVGLVRTEMVDQMGTFISELLSVE